MNRPSDLVAIPPLARTVIYYVLAIALVVIGALVGYDRLEPLWLVITSGVAGVFFGVAGSNVVSKPTVEDVGTPENPLAVDVTGPVMEPTGYGSGV